MRSYMHATLLLILVAGLAFFSSVFVVQQTEQVLLVQLGRLVRVIQTPGLYFKVPLVQNIISYDKRILTLGIPPAEVTLGDQKRAVVDVFLRYRIQNPSLFYKTLSSERGAEQRLSDLVAGVLRSTLGKYELIDLLSTKRDTIMLKIRGRSNEAMQPLGIEVVDVRIRRTDLPPQNNRAIFKRIISERKKEAVEIRAQGEERQRVIRAAARLEGELVMAKAEAEAGGIRGDGVKKAQHIYRGAYSQDPVFAHLYQVLMAAKRVLPQGTTYVLTPKHLLLSYFQQTSSKVSSPSSVKP